MKRLYIVLLFQLIYVAVFAGISGKITDKKGEPVIGAKVSLLHSGSFAISGTDGSFTLKTDTFPEKMVVQGASYAPDTMLITKPDDALKVVLKEIISLNEVAIVKKKLGLLKPRTAIFNTEKITATELCKAACCNLSESFETNPSVDVSYSDAATGAKQIKLLGLSGTYVQMLSENIPSLRGISTAYGLGFTPGPWMESIQVSKGTSSVINGYEAITGQINVEYKKPQTSEKIAVNGFVSNTGRTEANVNSSVNLSPTLSTGVLLHASDELMEMDQNKDNFMDMPRVNQYNLINRWYYKKGNYVSQLFVRGLSEKRYGGQLNGNYKIDIGTKRYEFFTKNGYVFNSAKGTSMGFIVSGSIHEQKAFYGLRNYIGKQGNIYVNLIFQTNFGVGSKISTGFSFNADKFDEKSSVLVQPLLRSEYVPGVFAEYSYNLNDKLIALGGLRVDHHSVYGTFVTPRMNIKYNAAEFLHFRASAGKGYRAANILAENNYLLASNRTINIAGDIDMEKAWNYGVSTQAFIPIKDKELTLSGEWYYTNFDNQVVMDMDTHSDAVSFANMNGKSFANSFQAEASMEIVRGLTATLAHRITDSKSTIGGVLREKALTGRSKSLFTASYLSRLKKWQYDFTTQWNGGGRLPDPDPINPRWDKEFKSYVIINTQITKNFKAWSVYAGVENLTNFSQKNPVIDVQNPQSKYFDASMVWGPVHGSKYYIGFRWSIDRED